MPLYPEKDEQHFVQFLWDSPNNRILFIEKIGTHKVTLLDYLASLLVNKDLVIYT